jgi:hypothetical protein
MHGWRIRRGILLPDMGGGIIYGLNLHLLTRCCSWSLWYVIRLLVLQCVVLDTVAELEHATPWCLRVPHHINFIFLGVHMWWKLLLYKEIRFYPVSCATSYMQVDPPLLRQLCASLLCRGWVQCLIILNNKAPFIKNIVAAGVAALIWTIWKTRNSVIFDKIIHVDPCSIVCSKKKKNLQYCV